MSKTNFISVSIDKTYFEAETLAELARANVKRYGDKVTVCNDNGTIKWYMNGKEQVKTWQANSTTLDKAEDEAYRILLEHYIEVLDLKVYQTTEIRLVFMAD